MAKLGLGSGTLLYVFFCITLVIPITKCHEDQPARHLKSKDVVTSLFVFGDSLFDVGNNNYINTTARASSFPYGETYFRYPTGRFSDGRLFPDFVAEHMKLPLIPPYLQPSDYEFKYGVNFASGGAGALHETRQGRVIDLKTQLSYFKNVSQLMRQKLGDTKTRVMLSRAVYLFSVGNNDYSFALETNSSLLDSLSPQQFVGLVIGNISEVIREIHEIGGRKFVFLNLGPLACTPSARIIGGKGGCYERITPFVELHNKELSLLLKNFFNKLKGFKYSLVEFHSFTEEIINQPSKYGFKEAKMACCGSGPYRGISSCGKTTSQGAREYELCGNASEYVFFDSAHPTERFNQLLVQKAWSGNPSISRPHTLKALFESK